MADGRRHGAAEDDAGGGTASNRRHTGGRQRHDDQSASDGRTRRGLLKTLGAVGGGSLVASAGAADSGRAATGTAPRSVVSSSHVLTGTDLDDWRVLNEAFGQQSAYSFAGDASLGIAARDLDQRIAVYEPDQLADGRRLDSFDVHWLETSGSFGGGLRLFDADGNVVCGFATDNPQWHVEHGDPNNQTAVGRTETRYESWVQTTVSFDWEAGTFEITFTNTDNSDNEVTETFDLVNATNVATVEVQNFASTVSQKSGWTGQDTSDYYEFSIEMFFDSMRTVLPQTDDGDEDAEDGTDDESDVERIVRVNTDGEKYQSGRVVSPPAELTPGSTAELTISVDTLIADASDNIVYGAVGSGDGDLYGLTQMPGTGSGTVTVDATIPTDTTGEVYWTWVPATTDSEAREEARESLSAKRGDELPASSGFSNDGVIAYSLGTVDGSTDDTEDEESDEDGSAGEPTLCVETVSVGVESRATAEVRLEGFDPGFSGADVTIRFPAVVRPIGATAVEAFDTTDASVDGQTAQLRVADLSDSFGPDDDAFTLGEITLQGVDTGRGRVEITDQSVDSDAGEAVPVTLASDCGDVTATAGACPTVDGTTTTDPDGDGRCEDFNGNGRTDFDDVTTFFENLDADAVEENPSAFDFNDNGRIDFDDIRALFDEVS